MLLQAWKINVEFATEDHPDDRDGVSVRATALPLYQYTTLDVTIYPSFWAEAEGEREAVIVHELAHAHTNQTKNLILRRIAKKRVTFDEATAANELLTETVANIVLQAYR